MARLTKAKEQALSLAFRVADAPEEQQHRIREELAKHGVVRDTAKEWFAILDGLDERTRNLARFEIRVDSAAAQFARNAARFAEQPPRSQGQQAETQQLGPVSETPPLPETPPVPELNTEAANAWLEETGIKDLDVVKRLDLVQQDTLARIAQINRRMAYLLVTYQPLINIAGPDEILDRVRTLMKRGSRDWTRLFDDTSLFSKELRFIRRSLRILDAAAITVATATARALKIRPTVTNIQWASLPQDARVYLDRRLRPYMDRKTDSIESMSRTLTADMISPEDEVIEVVTVSRSSPAFGIVPGEYLVRRQIRPFQLLLAAKMAGAKNVRFLLYGEPFFDEKYAEKLREAARELQLGMVIINVDQSTGETRYLFGETAARPEPKGSPIRRLPPLSMPRRFKMKAPPLVQADAATPKPDKGVKKFADHFNAELGSGVEAAVQWALAMRRASTDLSLPHAVRDVVGTLLGAGGRSVSPENGIQMLDEAIWGRMEAMFSRLDGTDDATIALLKRLEDRAGPKTFEEAYAIRDALADDREEFAQLSLDLKDLDRESELVDKICDLVHPKRVMELLGGTATDFLDIYVENYLDIEERMESIEARLSGAEAGLSAAIVSISIQDFLSSSDDKMKKARSDIAALKASVEGAGRSIEELITAGREQIVSLEQLFDAASKSHSPFPELAGVANLRKELAGMGEEAARYRDIVENDSISAGELERVKAETSALLEDITPLQSQYDSAKDEHAVQAGKLRQGARNLELLLEPTLDTGLPPPFEITKHSSRQIEGKGTLRLKRASESMRKQVGRRAHVFAPFDSARALIVRGKSYLVDSKAVGAVSKWLERRDGTLVLRDLLGQRIEIPQHFYGVRMVKVSDLREDHPFARVSAFSRARYRISPTAFDLMIALFSGISEPMTAGIWRQFLSTVAAIVPDPTAEGLFNEIMVRLEADRAILSLYEGVLEIPFLASFAERWFRFGDLDTTVSGDFLPISKETMARVGEMSLEEMTSVIEGTGLLPAGEKDRQAWVDEWMRDVDRRPPTMLWHDFAKWYGRLQKGAKYLPEPFKFVGAIVNKADMENILLLRMAARRFFAEQTVGRLDEKGIAHFALLFLFEHQRLIADVFRDRANSELDELELSDGDQLALLAGRNAFSGHDVKALAALAREFLRLRGTLTKQVEEILGDGVAAMFGRILMHKDALMIHNFSGMIVGMIQDLPNIREFLTENDIAKDFYGQETVESYVFGDFGHHWPFFERMLEFEPLELDAMSAEIDRAIELARGGGSGGAPSSGGGPNTSGLTSDGNDLKGGSEGGPTTASSEGLSDGAEFYLQMGMDAMGVPLGGVSPIVMSIRPVTVFR